MGEFASPIILPSQPLPSLPSRDKPYLLFLFGFFQSRPLQSLLQSSLSSSLPYPATQHLLHTQTCRERERCSSFRIYTKFRPLSRALPWRLRGRIGSFCFLDFLPGPLTVGGPLLVRLERPMAPLALSLPLFKLYCCTWGGFSAHLLSSNKRAPLNKHTSAGRTKKEVQKAEKLPARAALLSERDVSARAGESAELRAPPGDVLRG